MQSLDTIHDYLRTHSDEIGKRIPGSYRALHGADETPSPPVTMEEPARRQVDRFGNHEALATLGFWVKFRPVQSAQTIRMVRPSQ